MQWKSGARRILFLRGRPRRVLYAITLLAAAGCRGSTPSMPAPAPAGTALRVACPAGPVEAVLRGQCRTWASKSGIKVEIVPTPPGADRAVGPSADVWILPPAEMPRWVDAGYLLPVPNVVQARGNEYLWDSLLPLYGRKLLRWGETAYALPVLGGATLCYYRTDLLQDAGRREAFLKEHGRDLAEPATWEAFAEIAEFFSRHKRPPGLPPLPADDAALDRLFYLVAAPFARRAVREDEMKPPADDLFSFQYQLDTGEPRINRRGFVHALDLLKRLQACRPAGTAAEPEQAFRNGQAVLCLAGAEWIGRFQEKGSAVRDKLGVCRAPSSLRTFDVQNDDEIVRPRGNFVPYLGDAGWLGMVPKSTAAPDAAFQLLAFLGGPTESADRVAEPAHGGGVFRHEHFDKAGWQAFGLPTAVEHQLVEALRQTLVHPQLVNPALRLRTPDQQEHQRALVAELRAALIGTKEAKAALDAAAGQWKQLDAKMDRKSVLANYRLSIGLAPLP